MFVCVKQTLVPVGHWAEKYIACEYNIEVEAHSPDPLRPRRPAVAVRRTS